MAWKKNHTTNSANNNADNHVDAAHAELNYMDVKALSEKMEHAKKEADQAQAAYKQCKDEYYDAFNTYMCQCQKNRALNSLPLEHRTHKETEKAANPASAS